MEAVIMMFIGGGLGLGVIFGLYSLRPSAPPIEEIFDSVAAPGQPFAQTAQRPRFSLRKALPGSDSPPVPALTPTAASMCKPRERRSFLRASSIISATSRTLATPCRTSSGCDVSLDLT